MSIITIDPGHGGYDPGAVNGSRLEKDDNLRLSLAVANYLRSCGNTVIMTRSNDTFIPLEERSAISNRNGSDIFVSIHRNASSNTQANGVETYIQIGAPSQTADKARIVHDSLIEAGVQSDRGVKQANFAVLRLTNAPALMLEVGFISNDLDNRLFDRNFEKYAISIANGITEALGKGVCVASPGEPGIPPEPPVIPLPPSSSEVIRRIQSTLNNRYNTGIAVDGIAGSRTRNALIRGLQTELNRLFNAGLVVDGVFGPRTKAAVPNLRQGSSGNLVFLLQSALYIHGYSTNPDGIFGPLTAAAVRQFQAANGLTVDGVAGPNTFEKLFR